MHLVVETYVDANDLIAADLGAPDSTQVVGLRNLLGQVAAELTDAAVVTVAQGQQTGTRQLTDRIA